MKITGKLIKTLEKSFSPEYRPSLTFNKSTHNILFMKIIKN